MSIVLEMYAALMHNDRPHDSRRHVHGSSTCACSTLEFQVSLHDEMHE
jgi:hypothetical protein